MIKCLLGVATLVCLVSAPAYCGPRPDSGSEWSWEMEHSRTPSHFRYASGRRWYSLSRAPFCEAKDVYGNVYRTWECWAYERPKWRSRRR